MKSGKAVDVAINALAEPTRRAVVELLLVRAQRPGEMAETLGVSAQALSRHLRVLRASGLITDDEVADDARIRLYRLRPEALEPLSAWLQDVETFWGRQLAGFKQHAEARIQSDPRPKSRGRR